MPSEFKRLESAASLPVWQREERIAILEEKVEHDEHDRDLLVAGEHPLA
jgi:hypothetical protein